MTIKDKHISIVIENNIFSKNKDCKECKKKPSTEEIDDNTQNEIRKEPFEKEPPFVSEIRNVMANRRLYDLRINTNPFKSSSTIDFLNSLNQQNAYANQVNEAINDNVNENVNTNTNANAPIIKVQDFTDLINDRQGDLNDFFQYNAKKKDKQLIDKDGNVVLNSLGSEKEILLAREKCIKNIQKSIQNGTKITVRKKTAWQYGIDMNDLS
jgi:hypothetical protein